MQTSAHRERWAEERTREEPFGQRNPRQAPRVQRPRPWRLTKPLGVETTGLVPGLREPTPLRAVAGPVNITLLLCGDRIEEVRGDRGRVLQRSR